MIERTEERFEIKPAYLAADTAYGSADTLNWIVNERSHRTFRSSTSMTAEQGRNLGFDSLRQQRSRAAAQNLGQRIGKSFLAGRAGKR